MEIPILARPNLPDHTKHFISLPGRRVFFRKIGSGPILVIIHMSPLDSSHVLALANGLKHDFTCILPDSPGYGKSDPLPVDQPSIADYAEALYELLKALSVDECYVYGSHTGAKIALVLGDAHPDLVKGVGLDGLRITSKEQREQRKSGYAPRITPVTDGSHLQTTWQRVIETSKAWFVPNPDTPNLPQLINLMRSELAAKPWYGQAYSAAFAFDPMPTLEKYAGEALFIARDVDKLSLDCISKLPSKSNVHSVISKDDGTEIPTAKDLANFLTKQCPKILNSEIAIPASDIFWIETEYGSSRVRMSKNTDQESITLDTFSILETHRSNGIQLPGFGDSRWNFRHELNRENLFKHLSEVCERSNLGISFTDKNYRDSHELNEVSVLLESIVKIQPDLSGNFLNELWMLAKEFKTKGNLLTEIESTDLVVDIMALSNESLQVLKLIGE